MCFHLYLPSHSALFPPLDKMVQPQQDLIDCLSDDSDGLADIDFSSKTAWQKNAVAGQKTQQQQQLFSMYFISLRLKPY